MRIEEVFRTILNPLNEALRMDSRMAQLAHSAKHEFRFGIEYEFHVEADGDFGSEAAEERVRSDPMAMDMIEDRMLDEVNATIGLWFSPIAAFIVDLFDDSINDLFDERSDFERATNIDEDDEDSREQYTAQFENIIRLFRDNRQTIESKANDQNEEFVRVASAAGVNLEQMKDAAKEASGIEIPPDGLTYEKMVSLIQSDQINNIEFVIGDLAEENYEEGRIVSEDDAVELFVNSVFSAASIDTDAEEFIDRVRQREIDNFIELNDINAEPEFEDLKRIVEEQLSRGGILDDIEDIMPDGSVDQGVEVITKPLPFDDTMEVMNEMFDIIREVGYTSNKTGMHVNISHDSFKQGETPDPLKVTALMDIDFYQGQTNTNIVKYTARNANIMSLNQVIDLDDLKDISRAYIEDGFAGLETTMNRKVTSTRSQGINWTHILTGFNANTRRIEFRFFGGEGYERRKGEINKDLLYLMAVVKSITDKRFKPEDYKKGVIRILNRLTKNKTEYDSFSGFVNSLKENDDSVEINVTLGILQNIDNDLMIDMSINANDKTIRTTSLDIDYNSEQGTFHANVRNEISMIRYILLSMSQRVESIINSTTFRREVKMNIDGIQRDIKGYAIRELQRLGINPSTLVYPE